MINYRIATLFSVAAAVALTTACSTKVALLDVAYVSSKRTKIDTEAGEKVGFVESERVCFGENGLGLMETAVENALTIAGQGASYLKNASFSQDGSCVSVSGDAYK